MKKVTINQLADRLRLGLLAVLAALLALASAAPAARAHPHVWIDMRSALLFNGVGQITGLRLYWVFDEFYTVFALDGLKEDEDGKPAPDSLRELAELNITNLADYDYFTKLTLEGERLAFGTVTEYESFVWDDRLVLVFTVPLARPVNPQDARLAYAVFDPTYYIEILHVKEDPMLLEGSVPEGCTTELIKPNPDFETVSLAASLDRTESAGDGLGVHFAERVILRCEAGAG